jgi:drug/metabolite transporter (DMT)-like permease
VTAAAGTIDAPPGGNRLTGALARRPLLLVASGVVFYSTGPVLVAGSSVSGPVLSFWRLWIGVAVMGVAAAVPLRTTGRRPSRAGWALAGACGVAFGVHQLLFMTAIKRTTVIDVTLMQLLAPVIVGVLAAIVFGERQSPRFRLWSLLSIAGAGIVVLAGPGGPRGHPLGALLAFGNVAFFALYFIGSKHARTHVETTTFLFAAVVTAAVLVSVYVALAGESVATAGRSDLLIAATLAVVPGGLGHFVTTWQLHRVPANIPPLMQLAMPFLAGAMAWVVLGQGVGPLRVLGGAVTLIGVAGALRSNANGRRVRELR